MKFEQLKPESNEGELEKLKKEYSELQEKVFKQLDERTKERGGKGYTKEEMQQEPWFNDYTRLQELRDGIAKIKPKAVPQRSEWEQDLPPVKIGGFGEKSSLGQEWQEREKNLGSASTGRKVEKE